MRFTGSPWRNALLATLSVAMCAAPAFAQRRGGFGQQEGFRFRWVGPIVGNRVSAIAGVPGDTSTYYAGAASGGDLEIDRWRHRLDADFR